MYSSAIRAAATSSARVIRPVAVAPRAIATTSRLYGTSTMHENDPEVLEREKHRNLSRSSKKSSDLHDSAPGWNETLASASEASVKADRSDTNVKDMISKTVEFMREKRVENEENGFSTTAIYRRDEVKGPLADKGDSMVHTTEVKTQKTDHRGTPLKADEILLEEDWKGEMTRSEEAVKADRGDFMRP